MKVNRVVATEAALQLIEKLKAKYGPLMFHQSGGCCDGSSPMCYPLGEFLVGDSDVLLGEIGGAPFYMSESQFEYWRHTQLIIDVVEGRGGMFSLEGYARTDFTAGAQRFTNVFTSHMNPLHPYSPSRSLMLYSGMIDQKSNPSF